MRSLQANSLTFTIVPEIPLDYISKFYEYMNQFFLTPQKTRFTDISKGDFSVSYSVLDSSRQENSKCNRLGKRVNKRGYQASRFGGSRS